VRLKPSSAAVKNDQSHIKCLQDLAGQKQLHLLLIRHGCGTDIRGTGGHHRDRYLYLEDGGPPWQISLLKGREGGHHRDRYLYLEDGGPP
jgi:hypothetical protein